mmetsp:Transcript_36344/g.100136  ORF Transcript_36344/g.100136 Transcript_36344/m.100136 type:complete len:130 (-) Transcript_36344:122-511(-)
MAAFPGRSRGVVRAALSLAILVAIYQWFLAQDVSAFAAVATNALSASAQHPTSPWSGRWRRFARVDGVMAMGREARGGAIADAEPSEAPPAASGQSPEDRTFSNPIIRLLLAASVGIVLNIIVRTQLGM